MNIDRRFSYASRTLFFMLTAAAVGILPAIDASAQTQTPPAQSAPAASELLKTEELDQLLAPIALYSDALLSNVLMASTYPLEVIEADRWAKANKTLKGDALKTAVAKQRWDDSVKQLAAAPSVLDMMSAKLEWTQKLGDAVLAQQGDVMDAVQRLRARADAQNTLKTTPQQKVSKQTQEGKQVIVIEPAQPDTVYVPYYNPTTVYGAWPYPDYTPFYYPQPLWYPGTLAAGAIGFGLGAAVGAAWGGGFGWGNNNIAINRSVDINNSGNRFQHKVEHRGGVRYNNSQVAQKFGRGGDRAGANQRMDFRGRDGQGLGDRGGVGDRGNVGDRSNVGDRGGNRQNAGKGGGDRAGAGKGGGDRAGAGKGGGNRQAAKGGSRPSAAQRPAGGGGGLGNVGQGGRSAMAHGDRGRASMGGGFAGGGPRMGGGGPGMGAGGGGGFRGGGGGGGRGGGGGGRRSDEALKHDVMLLGTLDNGLGFYRFAYHGSDQAYVGVMAQEVLQVMPGAVLQGRDGYLRVRYEKLGLRFETYDQWLASGARLPAAIPARAN